MFGRQSDTLLPCLRLTAVTLQSVLLCDNSLLHCASAVSVLQQRATLASSTNHKGNDHSHDSPCLSSLWHCVAHVTISASTVLLKQPRLHVHIPRHEFVLIKPQSELALAVLGRV